MVTLREICIASMPFTTLGTNSRAARITGIVPRKKWKIDCSVGIAADPRLRGAQGPRLRARWKNIERTQIIGLWSRIDKRRKGRHVVEKLVQEVQSRVHIGLCEGDMRNVFTI
jgi:hypothetical protein